MSPGPVERNPAASGLQAWAARWPDLVSSGGIVAVAYSAGADSTALLAAAHVCWPGRVVALHVHHGLQSAADDFERVAVSTCELLGARIRVQHVDARAQAGQSPEDAARRARYEALADMARAEAAEVVLLGQHADDQVETFWLALSRGAGLPGLSGMPDRFERHGMVFGRPLLAAHARALRQWVCAQGLAFVDDPTNADVRFTRNRIRQRLGPAWQSSFPGYRETVIRSMRHVAQAQALLDELGRIDLMAVGTPPHIARLQDLSVARMGNVLRHWLRQTADVTPSEAQLRELQHQIMACRTRGHRLSLRVADGMVQREDECLVYLPKSSRAL